MIIREEFYVDSSDGIHMIHGYRWSEPGIHYKGILQIVHGMLEYVERYDEFARIMAMAGYFVIGHDHLGHGDSVSDPSELGYVGNNGDALWLKDIERVRRMAASCASKAPYILLGHSMGSYLARRYLIYRGDKVDAAVIMGTGHQPRALVKAGLFLTYLSMLYSGRRGHSILLDYMTCLGFSRRFLDNAHNGSWLSRDPQVMIRSRQDGRMRFRFSLSAYEALFRTIAEAVDPRRAARMPKALPLLLLSGEEDPVGNNGKDVRRFEAMLKKSGMKRLTCILYPKNRHELLNDLDKKQVWKDIQKWCNAILKEKQQEDKEG